MTTIRLRFLAAAWALLVLAAVPVLAQPDLAWVSRGAEDAHIIAYVINDDGSDPVIGTESGYRQFHWGTWHVFEEPGVPGRAVHAALLMYFTGGVITGRVDAEGHGYLERNYDSTQGQVVYSSTCGAFVDIDGLDYTRFALWAIARAGDTPGEMVVSVDQGATWQLVTGHGQQDLYDFVNNGGSGYLVGDAGIVYTPDNGVTWQDLTPGLPATEVRRLWESEPWSIPDKATREPYPVFVCTEAGVFRGSHDREAGTCVWEPTPLLAGPVRAYSQFQVWEEYGGSFALTDDGRVLLNPPLEDTWVDVTGSLAGMEILPVESESMIATAEDGLWYLEGLATAVDDLPAASPLALTAAPNPFNPATTVRFAVPHAGHARLTIHDLAGRRVATLLDGEVAAGPGAIAWRPQGLCSGVYVARLEAAGRTASARLVLVQ